MTERAKESDAAQIFAIESASIACAWTQKQIEDAIQNPLYIYIVWRENETVLGYACMRLAGDEAEINNIAVVSEKRRKGYGARLLERLLHEGRMQAVNTFFLEVGTENAAAIALYRKYGFCRIATRKNYYGEGRDAEIMKLHDS